MLTYLIISLIGAAVAQAEIPAFKCTANMCQATEGWDLESFKASGYSELILKQKIRKWVFETSRLECILQPDREVGFYLNSSSQNITKISDGVTRVGYFDQMASLDIRLQFESIYSRSYGYERCSVICKIVPKLGDYLIFDAGIIRVSSTTVPIFLNSKIGFFIIQLGNSDLTFKVFPSKDLQNRSYYYKTHERLDPEFDLRSLTSEFENLSINQLRNAEFSQENYSLRRQSGIYVLLLRIDPGSDDVIWRVEFTPISTVGQNPSEQCEYAKPGGRSDIAMAITITASFLGAILLLVCLCCYIESCTDKRTKRRQREEISLNISETETLNQYLFEKFIPMIRYSTGRRFTTYYKNQNECSICFAKFKRAELLRCIKLCKHVFHASCLAHWLRRKEACPLCNHPTHLMSVLEYEAYRHTLVRQLNKDTLVFEFVDDESDVQVTSQQDDVASCDLCWEQDSEATPEKEEAVETACEATKEFTIKPLKQEVELREIHRKLSRENMDRLRPAPLEDYRTLQEGQETDQDMSDILTVTDKKDDAEDFDDMESPAPLLKLGRKTVSSSYS